MAEMKNQPSGAEKRRLYAIAFCVAGGIEFYRYIFRDGEYRITVIGLAIMIAAVLFFVFSLLRDR